MKTGKGGPVSLTIHLAVKAAARMPGKRMYIMDPALRKLIMRKQAAIRILPEVTMMGDLLHLEAIPVGIHRLPAVIPVEVRTAPDRFRKRLLRQQRRLWFLLCRLRKNLPQSTAPEDRAGLAGTAGKLSAGVREKE